MEELTNTEKRSGLKKWFWRLIKIAAFAVVFLFIIFSVLRMLGGNNDILKQSIEQYFLEATGYQAKVDTLNTMTFFPVIGFDFEGLKLYERLSEEITPVATVDKMILALDFWDVMFRSGKFRALYIENVQAQAGVFFNQPLRIQKLAIEGNPVDAYLSATGDIGLHPFNIRLGLKVSKDGGAYEHAFGKTRDIGISIGQAQITATAANKDYGVDLESLAVNMDGQGVAKGLLKISTGPPDYNSAVWGELELTPGGTVLKPDLMIHTASLPYRVSGEVETANFNISDMCKGSRWAELVTHLYDIFQDVYEKPLFKPDENLTGILGKTPRSCDQSKNP